MVETTIPSIPVFYGDRGRRRSPGSAARLVPGIALALGELGLPADRDPVLAVRVGRHVAAQAQPEGDLRRQAGHGLLVPLRVAQLAQPRDLGADERWIHP